MKAYSAQGVKYDDGKPRVDYIPPGALLEVAKAATHGAAKYGNANWRRVAPSRYVGAALRHVLAFVAGEVYDKDSGDDNIKHLASAALNLCFALALYGEDTYTADE
jgi:hypothetical protein